MNKEDESSSLEMIEFINKDFVRGAGLSMLYT